MPETSNQQLQSQIDLLRHEIQTLKQNYSAHQHNDVDGTNHLRKNIVLDQDQGITIGVGGMISENNGSDAAAIANGATRYVLSSSVGPETGPISVGRESINAQTSIVHQPLDSSKVSWLSGVRSPLYVSLLNKTISVTSGGSTVTVSDHTFVANELTGALINIYDSSGAFVESHRIASNTSTVVTITGTWINSTSNGFYYIYMPMYVGISEFIWQRDYVSEGAGGGVRFGVGPTGAGQNGLLYMDATGDLYWRDKAGTSTKLN